MGRSGRQSHNTCQSGPDLTVTVKPGCKRLSHSGAKGGSRSVAADGERLLSGRLNAVAHNRTVFLFDAKPEKTVRDPTKRNGFVFRLTRSSAGKSAYVRKLTPDVITTAK